MNACRIAIVGATGAVGRTMLRILQERDFPVKRLFSLASARSAGTTVHFRDEDIPVTDLSDFDFANVDIALFSAGGCAYRQIRGNGFLGYCDGVSFLSAEGSRFGEN